MNDKLLRIYLNDHLALLVAETELIGRCLASNRGTPLGNFLQQLKNEVEAQKSIVRDILHRIGLKEGVESKVKQSTAWLVEKFGRFKLNGSLFRYSELSRLVELETLAAAAQERISLWDNFDAVASQDERLAGITFAFFRNQSQLHLEQLNTHRRFAAAVTFGGTAQT